jgi:hypothetical protein
MEFAKYRQHAFALAAVAAFVLAVAAFSRSRSLPISPTSGPTGQTPALPATSSGQTVPREVVPRDPKELLLAAAQVNGLDAPGLKPWHILVSYDKFDGDGDNVDSGTYEEFWVGASQYRLTYTSHDFTQTDFATENGLFRTGNDKWPGELQTRVRDEFVRPMFREMDFDYSKPEREKRDFGKVKLPCVMLRRPETGYMTVAGVARAGFCFEPDSLILRYSKGGMGRSTIWDQTLYSRIMQFQDRYVAGDVEVTQGGKPYLKLHLEKLESIPSLNPTDFIPPPTAVAIDSKPIIPDSRVLMLDYLVHQELPQYPKSIRPPGGEAVVEYRINKEGRVTAVQFVEGNSQMQKGLEEALKKFVYRPFLVRGEPVEVEVKQKFVYEIR